MIEYKLPNAAAHNITVTSTATALESLIDTAASATSALPNDLNMVELYPVDGDIHYLTDGNVPTTTSGMLVPIGNRVTISCQVSKMKLIYVTANVDVRVRVGRSEPIQ